MVKTPFPGSASKQGVRDASRHILQLRHGTHKLGISFAVIDGPVVEDWDIASLETGAAMVPLPMGEPFVFRPTLYPS